MILYHYESHTGLRNFGDELNKWLWPDLLPQFFDQDQSTYFISIGTLLSEKNLAPIERKIIFGTGAGYNAAPTVDGSFSIYFVRGPLTAKALGLGKDFAITDAAYYLTNKYRPKSVEKKYKFAYMPHVIYANSYWKKICNDLGILYIDPQSPIEQVLDDIGSAEKIIAEAMHGAIAADILRVPWLPAASGTIINDFKWLDWTQSVNCSYEPIKLQSIWNPKHRTLRESATRNAKIFSNRRTLKRAMASGHFQVSDENHFTKLNSRLSEQLEKLKSDFASRR